MGLAQGIVQSQRMHTAPPTRLIDSHTGGEPTRLVVAGGPDLGTGPMAERRERFRREHDRWRRALANEPRGNDVIVGGIVTPPEHAGSVCGIVFFNNTGYLGMCGHGTIGLVATLAWLKRIGPGVHAIDTPVGTVRAELHADGRVTVANVPAYRHRAHVALEVPGHGRVHGDVLQVGGHALELDTHTLGSGDPAVGFARPHELDVTRPGSDRRGGLPARVLRVLPLGASVRLELALDDDGQIIEAEIGRGRLRELDLREGESVVVRPATVRVFAAVTTPQRADAR